MNYIITMINASLQALFHIGKRFLLKYQYSKKKIICMLKAVS